MHTIFKSNKFYSFFKMVADWHIDPIDLISKQLNLVTIYILKVKTEQSVIIFFGLPQLTPSNFGILYGPTDILN
jgi:hypothetical protein